MLETFITNPVHNHDKRGKRTYFYEARGNTQIPTEIKRKCFS
jgi:hypothetical protein